MPFNQFYNAAGFLVPDAFQEMLVKNISVVAKADTKRAAAKVKKVAEKPEEEVVLSPELLSAVATEETQATGSEKKKASKRRKA